MNLVDLIMGLLLSLGATVGYVAPNALPHNACAAYYPASRIVRVLAPEHQRDGCPGTAVLLWHEYCHLETDIATNGRHTSRVDGHNPHLDPEFRACLLRRPAQRGL